MPTTYCHALGLPSSASAPITSIIFIIGSKLCGGVDDGMYLISLDKHHEIIIQRVFLITLIHRLRLYGIVCPETRLDQT